MSEAIPKPLIKNPRNDLVHQLLLQMNQVQWWTPIKIANNQLKEIRQLLSHAQKSSVFYGRRLQCVDIDNLDWESFREIAALTRDDIRDHQHELNSNPLPRSHGKVEEIMTSGSTGSPVVVRSTGITNAMWSAIAMRDHLWQLRDASKIIAAIRWRAENIGMAPEGWVLDSWGTPQDQFYKTGKGYFLNSSSNIADQVQWLHRINPFYLITHPSNLVALVQESERRGLHYENLHDIRTVGEALPNGLRDLVREKLNTRLIDCYSSQEVGYIAIQCPDHEHYHVQSESLYLEVVNEAGTPCNPGEMGKILVTSLRNFATPIIRYDIGDYGVLGNPCPCGRGLPVLQQAMGRVRNMLVLPDGNRRWPNLGFKEIMSVASIRQFQVVQHEPEILEFKLLVEPVLSVEQEEKIKNILRKYLDYPFQIDITYHAEIPRSAGGKYEDFLSLVETD
ncbi:MAG: phenylacetate--CoA ligase family protein [Proteobacteria bacterium]|nr:phenylacetate--CoA ligase family protein [Pseudomonadota bacterium]